MEKTNKTPEDFADLTPKLEAKLEIFDPKAGHNKFWRCKIVEEAPQHIYVVREWGRNGTKGQSMVERAYSTYEAKISFDKLYNEKTRKGYRQEASPLDKIVREV